MPFPPPRRLAAALLLATLALLPACRRERPLELILLVTVDTLRADHLGAYGNRHGLTPALDALAAGGVVFERSYTPAPFTLSAMAAVMTSRYPEEIGVLRNRSVVPEAPPTIAGHLASKGWKTGAVVSNFVLRKESGIARGFARFDDTLPEKEQVRGLPERTAGPTTDAALAMLDALRSEGGAVFLWVHYQDPHGPYTPPDPPGRRKFLDVALQAADARRAVPEGGKDESGQGGIPPYQIVEGRHDPAFYRAGYMGEVAHTDAMIARLLDGLRDRGLRDRAAIVFSADHGEGLGEHDYWFAHGEQLTEGLVHVPLIVSAPRLEAGRRRDVTSHLDLFPTIAALAGSRAPGTPRGRNLFDAQEGRRPSAVYLSNIDRGKTRRRALVDRELKYLRERTKKDLRARESLFALGTDEPELSAARETDLAALRSSFLAARQSLGAAAANEESQELKPDEDEMMRSLGYVGGN